MTKTELYDNLVDQLEALLTDERDFIANAANTASLIYHSLPELNWAGFYFLRDAVLHDTVLIVGPFQGKPACTRIAMGKGVCGTAAEQRRTLVVDDVHRFPGHIACDGASKSEIVLPLVQDDRLIGVLDLDSPELGRFDADDQAGLEALVEVFLRHTDGAYS